MRIIILLYCVWLASAGTVPEKCDGVTFDGKYYDKEVLTNIKWASRFSLDKDKNTLFFSYFYPEDKNSAHAIGIAYYNIDTKELKDLMEVVSGSTTTIDPETGDVYLGGTDGIYKFDPINKIAVPYAAEGVNIFFVYYNKFLFYTTFPDYEIYRYDGKESEKISNTKVQKLILVDKNKSFFVNSTGLYRVLSDKVSKAEIFSDSLDGFKVFAKDNNNKIFVTGHNSVYVPNEEKKKIDKVADIEGIRDLVFDKNNNIIYSDSNSIYRLTPSEAKCPADSI